jgi:hypothetical protein
MGFMSDNQEISESEALMNEQIRNNKVELEAKKQSLFQTRLDIIKGQGGQLWHADRSAPARGQGQGYDLGNPPKIPLFG